MKISPTKVAIPVLAIALLASGLPATGQESLLPEGFGDPAPAPAPTPVPAATPRPGAVPTAAPSPIIQPLPGVGPSPTPTPTASPTPLDPSELLRYELPESAKRSLLIVGVPTRGSAVVDASGWGDADGRFLQTLMRRLDAPVASRWLHIGLRRVLLAQTDTPTSVNGADFAAERAWLLIRMGESTAARSVTQAVDVENYTPKLYQIAMQTQLATGDAGGLCPLVGTAREVSNERGWVMAQAMCAGLGGNPDEAGRLADAARRQRVATGIDYVLAEKVVGSGAGGRRAVTVEWDGVTQLTAWRYGLAMATASEIPEDMMRTVGGHVGHWSALSPVIAPESRVVFAEPAARAGVLSNAALIDLYAAIDESGEGTSGIRTVARDLRTAYVAQNAADRIAAMRTLWDEPGLPGDNWSRMILTARAASQLPPSAELVGDADRLIASMLTAGLDRAAMRWRGTAAQGSLGQALLALADPNPRVRFSGDLVDAYNGTGAAGDARRTQLFLAGLAGLGRLSEGDIESAAQSYDLAVGAENSWTRAIAQAAQNGEPATVMLLAGTGMQTPDWRGVPPETLFHIVSALRVAGLEGYARMIAAEALSRS
ncbi:hypothetical protein [Sphingomonas sp. AX6]|uniref:hypothetical protein n=1 Tax=Sphingomonas sp. AX6 TaxID=2653171 RepID=UPI0012F25CB6|nr:hypothetical protein [Sphingomonas sp. AX6]VXC80233.1 conserved exported hypothetical protein [Sphingomonas sp. AX6]